MELQFEPSPTLLYSVHDEYASGPQQRTPLSNFLRGAKWSPDGACLLTASDDNCLRVYDTPLEAFHTAGFGADDDTDSPAAAAAAAAAADGLQAANTGTQQAAGQRAPAQLPATPQLQQQQQQQGKGDTLQPALRLQCGELLYDYCWFSAMSAADPASCCIATTGRAQPVHLWDALTGQLRCTYRAYNELDEVVPAHSLAFSPDGTILYCGFNKVIRSFRVERPGRDCRTVAAYKKGQDGLPGIVSCMALNPDRQGMLAAGSYCGSGLLLDTRTRGLLCLLEGGHAGGITHLCFSADGNFLYTGARRDPAILCWDVRYSSGVVYSMQRASAGTNQRMYFDVEPCGRHLATGGEDGIVKLFDLRDGSQAGQFVAAEDTVNGVHFHPFLPLLATASGQRRYFLAPEDDDSSASGSDSEASSSSSDSSSDSSGSSDRGSDGGRQAGGAASDRRRQLSAQQNVLNVWHCSAIPVQPQAEEQEEAMMVEVVAEEGIVVEVVEQETVEEAGGGTLAV